MPREIYIGVMGILHLDRMIYFKRSVWIITLAIFEEAKHVSNVIHIHTHTSFYFQKARNSFSPALLSRECSLRKQIISTISFRNSFFKRKFAQRIQLLFDLEIIFLIVFSIGKIATKLVLVEFQFSLLLIFSLPFICNICFSSYLNC